MKLLVEDLKGISLNDNQRKALDYIKELVISQHSFSIELRVPELIDFLGCSRPTGYNVLTQLEKKNILNIKGSLVILNSDKFHFEYDKKQHKAIEEDDVTLARRVLENLEADMILGDLWTEDELVEYCETIKKFGHLLNHPQQVANIEKAKRYYSDIFARL